MDIRVSSIEFPELPELGLTLPPGWERAADGPALLTARAAENGGHFRANVVLSTSRRDAPVEPAWVAAGVIRRLSALPEAEPVQEKQIRISELPGTLVRVAWRHPAAGTLVQSVLTVPVPLGPVVHVVELVGSLGGDRVPEDAGPVDEVLRSLRI